MAGAVRRLLGGMVIATATRVTVQGAILPSDTGAVAARIVGRSADDGSSIIGYKSDGSTQRWLLNFDANNLNVQVGDVVATQFKVFGTASAVNCYLVTGGGTGTGPNLSATGADTNVSALFTAKGTGSHVFRSNGGSLNQLEVKHTASAVNRMTITGGATGVGATLGVAGETNADLLLAAVGTGAVKSAFGLLSSSATIGVGYSTGAGGAVTQATSKATGVTLNKPCGEVTMNAAALAATTSVSFTLTNSTIAADDSVVAHRKSGGTAGAYDVYVDSVAAGSCVIRVKNNTAGSLSEAVVLTFSVVKAVKA